MAERNVDAYANFVETETLDNGLTVVCKEIPSAEFVSARLTIKAGSRWESEEISGATHKYEHRVWDGSVRYPTRRDLDTLINRNGGHSDCFTGQEFTTYAVKFPKANAQVTAEFIRELVYNPLLDLEMDSIENGIITAELLSGEDNTAEHRSKRMKAHVWNGHSLGRNGLGSRLTIPNLTPEALTVYRDHVYSPNNSVLVFSGNITNKEAVSYADRNFSDLKPTPYKVPESLPPYFHHLKRVLIEGRDTEMVYYSIAFSSLCGMGSDDSYLMQLIGNGLAEDIFYKFVYEKGFSYSASGWPVLVSDAGLLFGYFESQPKDSMVAVMTLSDILRSMEFTQGRLDEIKASMISGMRTPLEEMNNYSLFVTKQHFYTGSVKSPDQIEEEIRKISLDEANEALKLVIDPQRMALIATGPIPSNVAGTYEEILNSI